MKIMGILLGAILAIGGIALGAKLGAEAYLANEIDKSIKQSMVDSGQTNPMLYKDVKVSLFRKTVTLNRVQTNDSKTGKTVHINALIFGGVNSSYLLGLASGSIDPKKDYPDEFYVKADGILVPDAEMNFKQKEILKGLGYRGLLLSMMIHYKHQPAEKLLNLKISMSSHKVGKIKADLIIGGYDSKALMAASENAKTNPTGALPHLMAMTLASAELTYEDDSFVKRLDYYLYQKQKTTVAHSMKKLRIEKQGRMPATVDNYLGEFIKFAEKPGKIVATIKPEKPLGGMELFMGMQNSQALIKQLNISLKAN